MDPRFNMRSYGLGANGSQNNPARTGAAPSFPFMSVGMGMDGKPLQPPSQAVGGYTLPGSTYTGQPSAFSLGGPYGLQQPVPASGISLSQGLPNRGVQLGAFSLQTPASPTPAAYSPAAYQVATPSSSLDLNKRDSVGYAPAHVSSTVPPQPSQPPAAPSGTSNIQNLFAKLQKGKAEVQAKQKGVDLAFVIDCTYSMGEWIKQVKRKIREIVKRTQEIEEGIRVRVAFVGYRDYTPEWPKNKSNGLVFLDFTEQISEFRAFVKTVKEDAGHDYPEDVAGGFAKALNLSWTFNTKVLIHIGDAPPHGDKYNTGEWVDNFPKGDPAGGDCEDMLLTMAEKRIDYYFAKIGDDTRLMEDSFKKTLRTISKTWAPLDLKAGSDEFLPKVVASVNASVRSSMGGPSIPRNM